jgi:hypothetical protein
LLLRNVAGKRAEARIRILADDEDIDAAMKTYKRYERIIFYLFNRWYSNRKMKEYGSA